MKKKAISAILAAAIAVSVFSGCGTSGKKTKPQPADTKTVSSENSTKDAAEDASVLRSGVLSYLNYSEDQFNFLVEANQPLIHLLESKGYATIKDRKDYSKNTQIETTFYDSLDSMVMALHAGEIDYIDDLPQCTADYLCQRDDELEAPIHYNMEKKREENSFEYIAFQRLSNGFAFLLKQDDYQLCDDFNRVIAEMEGDKTLERLVKEQITDVAEGKEPAAVELAQKDGRETLKIAVTGSLPPIDYVAADGSFAGFNTAFLAEVGERLGKNIRLVQVDSPGRAAALASGNVDVVFWCRQNPMGSKFANMLKSELQDIFEGNKENMTEEEATILDKSMEAFWDGETQIMRDIPDGCIATEPYYRDICVPVVQKNALED